MAPVAEQRELAQRHLQAFTAQGLRTRQAAGVADHHLGRRMTIDLIQARLLDLAQHRHPGGVDPAGPDLQTGQQVPGLVIP